MRFLFISLMLLCTLNISAQLIVKNFAFNNFNIEVQDNYSVIDITNAKQMASSGNPVQPFILTNFLLPPGAEYTSVEVKILEKKTVELLYDVMPMQFARPLSEKSKPIFVKNKVAYTKSCVLSITESITVNQERMNGHEILQVKFSPIQYNAKNRTVMVATKAQLIVNYKISKAPAFEMISLQPKVQQRIADFCDNPKVIQQYQALKVQKNEVLDALIITPEEFAPDFEPLIHDYIARGVSSTILTTEDIENLYQGIDKQEKIRNAIIDYYQNNDIMYVLLGGDVEHIPHRGFFCQVQSSSVYEDNNIPADLYYMALDGTWNDNNNNNWGEPDEDDLIPEVALSRMPFTTHDELAKMLNKTLKYTNAPVIGELNNPLLAGEHLYDDPVTWGAQYLDLIHGSHDDNGYSTSGIPDTDPFVTLYDRDNSWSASDIIAEINNGHPFIHHVGHSNTDYTMRLYNSDITNSNFNQVDGETHNYPLIYTHGCICGAFDNSDCIAEEMLQIDNFAVAFIGNSRYGWFNEGQTEGPSQHMHREFVDALYTDGLNCFAEAHLMSKIETSGWVEAADQHEHGAIRWCFYDCNALGEPILPIWTNAPREISTTVEGNLYIGESTITVNTNENGQPAENINISIVRNGEIYGSGTSNINGVAEITLNSPFTTLGEVQIIHSGYNILKDTTIETLERPDQAYLVVSEIDFGADIRPVYGKNYNVNLLIDNVGETNSLETTVEISTSSEFATITNGTTSVSTIAALQQELITGCFNLQISNTIEDGTPITFNFDFFENNSLVHSMEITLKAMAPKLSWNTITINDNAAGNGNGIFDPGEIIMLEAVFNNQGSIQPKMIQSSVINNSKNITILTDTVKIIPLGNQNTYHLQFAVTATNEDNESIVDLTFNSNYDNYTLSSRTFNCIIGQVVENFESGNFNMYPWQNNTTHPWQINSTHAFEGEYCSQSHNINDGQTSELNININVPEENNIVSFMYKVSCEDGNSSLWDYLEFVVDGNRIEAWSGEINWSFAEYPISEGNHTLTWRYVKDGSMSSGDDCAWLDQITLPIFGSTLPTDNSAPVISSENELDLTRNEPFTHTITATDADGDNMTANLVLSPSWMQISNIDANNWTLSGAVPMAISLVPNVIVAVGDEHEYTSQTMNVNIDGLSIENSQPEEFSIYPIPAKDYVYVSLKNDYIKNIQLISIEGKIIYNLISESRINKYKLETQNLQHGLYLLQILTSNNQIINKKIIFK